MASAGVALAGRGDDAGSPGLWSVYEQHFSAAKYVSLSHVLDPSTPIWYGFDPTRLSFSPATSGNATVKPVGQPYTYADDGFEATEYVLPTDQYGTQLDPPAHWNPIYPAIDPTLRSTSSTIRWRGTTPPAPARARQADARRILAIGLPFANSSTNLSR